MFRCCSLRSSLPRHLPLSPKVCSIHLCLFFCLAYRVILTIFLNSIYMCQYTVLVQFVRKALLLFLILLCSYFQHLYFYLLFIHFNFLLSTENQEANNSKLSIGYHLVVDQQIYRHISIKSYTFSKHAFYSIIITVSNDINRLN